jgi:hypothetical protein
MKIKRDAKTDFWITEKVVVRLQENGVGEDEHEHSKY